MNEFLLEAFPNPERVGCPDESVLKALAEGRLPSNDPVCHHVGSCSECYAEYRHYRLDWNESAVKTLPTLVDETTPAVSRFGWKHYALAASLLIVFGLASVYLLHRGTHFPVVQVASNEPVNAEVDLFNVPTLRGGADNDAAASPLGQVSLPASIIHLALTLPRFSQSGPYDVVVSQDRAGHQVVAKGQGTGTEANGKVMMNVTLDLRSVRAGTYFLATVRDSDNGTYYYPLKIN
jgi:hypothetical protein